MHNSAHCNRNQSTHSIICIFILLIFLNTGCSSVTIQKEPTKTYSQLTSIPEESLPKNSSKAPLNNQKLRIINKSTFSIQRLEVWFPQDGVDFGDVLPGATTDYQVIPHGVYRYAAYVVEINGQKYEQPVVDWVGESPMNGKAFTYILDVDPSKWKTKNQVILLLNVSEDQ